MSSLFRSLKKMCCNDKEQKQYKQIDMLSQQEDFLKPRVYILGSEESGKNEFMEQIQSQNYGMYNTTIKFQERTYHFDVNVPLNNKQIAEFKIFSINEQYSLQTSQITQYNIESMNGIIIMFSMNNLKSFELARYYLDKVKNSITQHPKTRKIVTIIGVHNLEKTQFFSQESQISNNKDNNTQENQQISEDQLLYFRNIGDIIENAIFYELDISKKKSIQELFKSRSLMTYKLQKEAGVASYSHYDSNLSKSKKYNKSTLFKNSVNSDRSSIITLDLNPQQESQI